MVARIVIYTVGHSTRSREQLLEILRGAGVSALADVRSYPSSRRHPQFNRPALARWLPEAGIEYRHFPELGGRREPVSGSRNGGWRERGFRGYADYMALAEFGAGVDRLQQLARTRAAAIMCAEALWWRCHRRLIADALTIRGWEVCHLGSGPPSKHELTPFAQIGEEGTIVYPPPQASLEL
jgi:uncharacterized protein (DUF488 family)